MGRWVTNLEFPVAVVVAVAGVVAAIFRDAISTVVAAWVASVGVPVQL